MTTTTLEPAISGPPPVATRHDHQGVIVTSIDRPDPKLVAACRSLYTGLVLDHLGNTGAWRSPGAMWSRHVRGLFRRGTRLALPAGS